MEAKIKLAQRLNLLVIGMAMMVTGFIGSGQIYPAKVAGIALALAAFVPVYYLLKRAVGLGEFTLVIWVLIGGFFFKTLALLIGVYIAAKVLEWDVTDFAVGCLSFVVAFQIVEAGYFWSRQE